MNLEFSANSDMWLKVFLFCCNVFSPPPSLFSNGRNGWSPKVDTQVELKKKCWLPHLSIYYKAHFNLFCYS